MTWRRNELVAALNAMLTPEMRLKLATWPPVINQDIEDAIKLLQVRFATSLADVVTTAATNVGSDNGSTAADSVPATAGLTTTTTATVVLT